MLPAAECIRRSALKKGTGSALPQVKSNADDKMRLSWLTKRDIMDVGCRALGIAEEEFLKIRWHVQELRMVGKACDRAALNQGLPANNKQKHADRTHRM